jgi:hypothetical protein
MNSPTEEGVIAYRSFRKTVPRDSRFHPHSSLTNLKVRTSLRFVIRPAPACRGSEAEGPAVRRPLHEMPGATHSSNKSQGLKLRSDLSSRANSGFPTTLRSSTATYAAFFKESHMSFTETTKSHRKSGGSRRTCGAPSPHANAGCPHSPGFPAKFGLVDRRTTYRQSSLACINPWFNTVSNDGCFLI